MENNESGESITERLKNAGEVLGVNRREIAEEITRLAEVNDMNSMKEMFEAYKAWEIKGRPSGTSIEHAEELAMRNFDVVARVADNQQITRDDISALRMTVEQDKSRAGKITRFYRKAIGYTPSQNTSSDN